MTQQQQQANTLKSTANGLLPSEMDVLGKLRSPLKWKKFAADKDVIYVKASVLNAISDASLELNKAQRDFVANTLEHADTAGQTESLSAAAATEHVLAKQAQMPWGKFDLMDKLVDESQRGKGKGGSGGLLGMHQGDWMQHLKQKKKKDKAKKESLSETAARGRAAQAQANEIAAMQQAFREERKRAVAMIWANWLRYKLKKEARPRCKTDSPEPYVHKAAAAPRPEKPDHHSGSGSGDDGEDTSQVRGSRSQLTTHALMRDSPAPPPLKSQAAQPDPSQQQPTDEQATAASDLSKPRRRKRQQAATAQSAVDAAAESGDQEEGEGWEQEAVEEAFQEAECLMMIAQELVEEEQGQEEEASEGEQAESQEQEPDEGKQTKGWEQELAEGQGGERERGKEGLEESTVSMRVQRQYSVDGVEATHEEHASCSMEGVRKVFAPQSPAQQGQQQQLRRDVPIVTAPARSRAPHKPQALPAIKRVAKLLCEGGDYIFSRFGWTLRSEVYGPLQPIDPAILMLLKNVMAEANRARKGGNGSQAMRLVSRATNLLRACLKPMMSFAAGDDDEADQDPPVAFINRPFAIATHMGRAESEQWWTSGGWGDNEPPEDAPRQRPVGGAQAGMSVRMRYTLHRHQKVHLVPLVPPTITSDSTETPSVTSSGTSSGYALGLPLVHGRRPNQPADPPPATPSSPRHYQPNRPAGLTTRAQAASPSPQKAVEAGCLLPLSPSRPGSSWSPWLQNGKSKAAVRRADSWSLTHVAGDEADTDTDAPAPVPSVEPMLAAVGVRASLGTAEVRTATADLPRRSWAPGDSHQVAHAWYAPYPPPSVSSSWSPCMAPRHKGAGSRAGHMVVSASVAEAVRQVLASPGRSQGRGRGQHVQAVPEATRGTRQALAEGRDKAGLGTGLGVGLAAPQGHQARSPTRSRPGRLLPHMLRHVKHSHPADTSTQHK